jgi:hypothetical protein
MVSQGEPPPLEETPARSVVIAIKEDQAGRMATEVQRGALQEALAGFQMGQMEVINLLGELDSLAVVLAVTQPIRMASLTVVLEGVELGLQTMGTVGVAVATLAVEAVVGTTKSPAMAVVVGRWATPIPLA